MIKSDLVVIGGGLVGLGAAYAFLQRYPGKSVSVLEKEDSVAFHQSGRNSGVLHSGIYYKPGSYKARNCVAGRSILEEFCREQGIAVKRCGKLIVAGAESELPALDELYRRGEANGVRCRMVGTAELREIEPHASGVRGIHVEETGVVDFKEVARRLCTLIEKLGGQVFCGEKVERIEPRPQSVCIVTHDSDYESPAYVNCAGLFCDRILEMAGCRRPCRIIPFRGEYFKLKLGKEHLCRALIYPVPNPAFPFLGVHFTRSITDEVECGPNAVLALAREGYDWRSTSLPDSWDSLSYPGFWKMAFKYWRDGASEIVRSLSKTHFVASLRRLVPEVRADDLVAAPAGVRAQAVAPDGKLVDDFLIERTLHGVHVLNAPSPAATSCLSIGRHVAEQLEM